MTDPLPVGERGFEPTERADGHGSNAKFDSRPSKEKPPESRAVSFSQIVVCALLGPVHVRERTRIGLGGGLGALGGRDPLRERRRGGGDQKGGNNKDLEVGHRRLLRCGGHHDHPWRWRYPGREKPRVLNRTLHLFIAMSARQREALHTTLRAFFRSIFPKNGPIVRSASRADHGALQPVSGTMDRCRFRSSSKDRWCARE